ncbi:hypothetical protein MKW94_029065 [Papaver nudicaule]|uniref:SPX domain-containing protein n=1 Tax=Papaver nudicaule TaxID=74823 RepID=A0AA41V9G9_PAPNU|nr:hypothetical protein [Papaver nudicaule]
MVKFSKQFEGQLIPEWKEAFVDYSFLKKDLKKIHLNNNDNVPNNKTLKNSFFSPLKKLSLFGHQHRREHGVIQVHKRLASSASKGDLYETELLDQFADTDAAKEFFSRLDLQLNKVNQFYKAKEKEFMERGGSLEKQMEILVNLKAKLKQQRGQPAFSQELKEDASHSCDEDSIRGTLDQVELQEASDLERREDQLIGSPVSGEIATPMKIKREDSKTSRSISGRHVVNFQGRNVRINIPLTTPTRTLSALGDLVWEDLVIPSKKCSPARSKQVQVNKTKVHHAEKMIRGAFVELYKGLGYLKTYRYYNHVNGYSSVLHDFVV